MPENELAQHIINDFIVKHDVKIVALENDAHVEHRTLKYHGTPDFIGFVDEEPCVLDWKTSSQIANTVELQLALYAHAWNYMGRKPRLDTGWVVRVDKETKKVEARRYENLMALKPVLRGIVLLWDYFNPSKRK